MKTEAWILDSLYGDEGKCIIWPFAKNSDTGVGVVRRNGVLKKASRYICERFHGHPGFPGLEAAHSCGNGHLACVNPNHLSWKTKLENEHDKLVHGTRYMGESHHFSKITKDDLSEIFKLRSGGSTQIEIARKFDISQPAVSMILSGKRWENTKSQEI
jgi:hypothetical protein